jgi:hypothetical protein
MLSPNSSFHSGSYVDLRGYVLRRLRLSKINDRIFELIQSAYNGVLTNDQLVLSAVEKRRLLAEVLKSVLQDMSKRLDE